MDFNIVILVFVVAGFAYFSLYMLLSWQREDARSEHDRLRKEIDGLRDMLYSETKERYALEARLSRVEGKTEHRK